MFSCWVHRVRCVKCNRLYKVKYYHNLVWYCKLNFKTNLLRFKIPKNILYLHIFKCSNCKEKYQADSYLCSFWKHWFNKKWHLKKYQKFHENRNKLIHLVMDKERLWFWRILKFFHKMFKRIDFLLK